jgi:hypothetical protein
MVVDAHCLYYAKVPNLALRDPNMLASLNIKAMESIWKEHMTSFHKWILFVTPHLVLNSSNEYMFIITWILILKWWWTSYNSLCLHKWAMSRRCLGLSSGTSLQFWGKLRNFPRLGYQMPFLRNGCTRQPFGFKCPPNYFLIE